MKTVRELNSIGEVKNHLNKFYNAFDKEVEDIIFQHVGYDDRINWDTYYVLCRLKGCKHFNVVGMSDSFLVE